MDITRIDPTAVTGASSSLSSASTAGEKSSNLSFADVLKTSTKQAETGRSGAISALLNRGVASISPAAETGAPTIQAVAPTDESVADAASTLKEWGGASRSKKAKNGESPLGLSANDASLAGRYDVVARRGDSENRGVRHSQRA